MSQKSRHFVFTLNNYTDEQLNACCEGWNGQSEQRNLTYLGFGKEVGAVERTPHLQGYVRFQNQVRWQSAVDALRALFGLERNPHVERARGSATQAIAYCEKDGNYTEYGVRPAQGKRTDLGDVLEKISAGATVQEACEENPSVYVKFQRGLQGWAQLQQPHRDWPMEVIWCWGPTGSGKSRYCHEQAPSAYWKDPCSKWWDNYQNESDVVIDDFRPCKELSLSFLLRLCDRYKLQVESKGGYLRFNSKRIFFTAPKRPDDLLRDIEWVGDEKIEQLMRRVTKIIHFDSLI